VSAFRVIITLIVIATLLLAPQTGAAEGILAPPAAEDPLVAQAVRPRPAERPFENEWAQPESAEPDAPEKDAPNEVAPEPTAAPDVRHWDDPVLYWLPEITAASNSTGTPRSLIAGIMRLESGGEPGALSVVAAQGLMQVMPFELETQGIPQEMWQDPATNIMAGAVLLAQRSGAGWETSVAYYFGIGCDAYGTCTREYVDVVLHYANFYAGVLVDPYSYDPSRLPDVPSSGKPIPPDPTETPVPTEPAEPAETPVPTEEPAPDPTAEPTEIPTEAPPAPTDVATSPAEEPPLPAPAEEGPARESTS